MELRIYLRMLLRGWWLIALTTLAALNAALVVSMIATPIYRASTRFVVSPNPTLVTAGRDVVNSLEVLDKRSIVQTYAEFLNSTRVLSDTLTELQFTEEQIESYKITSVVLPDANILELSVEGPDPNIAAVLANSVGQHAISTIGSLYQVYNISVLDPAVAPAVPVSPQPLRDASLAAALGMIIGAAIAILREQIRIPLDAYRQRTILDHDSSAYTHRYFMRLVEEELIRNDKEKLSLGLIQLNGLRDLVDTLPQPVVQRLMRRVTGILRKELRGNDIVGRWSSAQFAIMLPSTSEQAATRTLERIKLTLSEPVQIDDANEQIQLLPRVSVATFEGGETANQLAERIEHLLEKAV